VEVKSKPDLPNHKNLLKIVVLTIFLCVLPPFFLDGYSPSLPAITRDLSSEISIIQLTMTLYMLGAAIGQLFYGPFSDRFGRRTTILLGLIICIIGTMLCLCASTPWSLITGRVLQGSGIAVCIMLFRVIMRDVFTGPHLSRILSYIGMYFAIATAIAPILGGYIQEYFGWRANFIFMLGFILLVTIGIYLYLPETNSKMMAHNLQLKKIAQNYFTLLCHRQFILSTLLSSIAFSGFMCYYATTPFLLQDILKLSAAQYGWLSLVLSTGTITGFMVNSRLVMRLGIFKMLISGIILILLCGLSMMLLGIFGFFNVYVIMIPMIFFSIASGLIASNAVASAFNAFPHIAGTAGALFGFIQMFFSFIASLVLSELHEPSQIPLAIIFISMGLIGLLILMLLKEDKKGNLIP
jgi:Bcr/CflA subfamily drug resistance transporter